MIAEGKRHNLGRGLSALLGEDETPTPEVGRPRDLKTVPVGFLEPGRYQPRHRMDDQALADLAQSIREKGILQPILVRRHGERPNAYEIIAGERRWRAAQLAQLHEVPIVVKELSDTEALEIALVENLQRQDLSAIEEAEGYRRLMEEFHHTHDDLAKVLGKSRSHVTNMIRLLALPEPVKARLEAGTLSAGHARALLTAKDPVALAEIVVKRGLNVRQTESLVKRQSKGGARPKAGKDPDTAALEHDLSTLLGLRAEIHFRGKGGTLVLHYGSLEQLDDILRRLKQEPGYDAQGSDAG